MKVLIVDDEEFIRDLISEIIAEQKYISIPLTLLKATNGKEALQIYQQQQPEIVVTDMVMPEMNGAALINEIRKTEKNETTDIIVMTGFADLDMALSLINKGVADMLRKPFRNEEFLFSLTKIIEKKRLLNENLEFQLMLKQKERLSALGMLSAGIAHEINNPSAYVITNLELIKKYLDLVMPEIKKIKDSSLDNQNTFKLIYENLPSSIESALSGSKRIQTIVSDLLSYSHRSQRGRNHSQFEKLLDQALNLVKHRTKSITIKKEIDADLKKIHINDHDIVQSFMNIILNAVDAIEHKAQSSDHGYQGEIIIRARDDTGNNHQIISFEDNGCGMAEEAAKKIFDPFFTTKEVGKGTGLGMSVTKGNIDNNEGRIFCRSEMDQGTEIILHLPHSPH